MEKKRYTQIGTFSIIIIFPILIFCLIMLFTTGIKDPVQAAVMGFVSLTMLICLLIFYKITIIIDDQFVRFRLGIGLIRKEYNLSDIKSCQAIRNSPFYGIGIRKIPKGWLYNVSGLSAIELSFKNSQSVVRIGTNNPEAVSQTINSLIRQETYVDTPFERSKNRSYYSVLIFFIAIILPVSLILIGNREIDVKTTPESFSIKGIYGVTVKYSDILELDTIQYLPKIKARTNGYEFGYILKGNFSLSDNTRAKLFVIKETSPYIYLHLKDMDLYINFKDRNKTLNLYNQIVMYRTNTGK